MVSKGSAGFACEEDPQVKKVNEGGKADQAGVQVGMVLVAFQGEALEPGKTWAVVREKIKSTQKPWAFGFSLGSAR